jgi:hypothetical protein
VAVLWQASGTLLGSTGADITPVNPAHQADDILILHAWARSDAVTLTTPGAGAWTPIAGPTDQSTTMRNYWYWIRATSGAMADPLCDWSATGNKYGVVHCIRGAVTSGNPIEASQPATGTAAPGVVTGITSLTAGALICSIGMSTDNTLSAVAATATDPSALTQRDFEAIATGNDAAMWISTANRTDAGATGNVSHAFTGAVLAWGILVAAIAEAVAAAGPESYGRPAGLRGARQFGQLIAQ